jgi:hypothetical protein
MHEWRVVFHCLLGVEDTGKRFPIHFNEIDGLVGDIGIDGRRSGDFLADIAGFADGKYVLIGEESSPGTFDGVFRRDTPRTFAALLVSMWRMRACG